jgi:hypothetical protein
MDFFTFNAHSSQREWGSHFGLKISSNCSVFFYGRYCPKDEEELLQALLRHSLISLNNNYYI